MRPDAPRVYALSTSGRESESRGMPAMYAVSKTSVCAPHLLSLSDTTPVDPDPDPKNLWLFTDPAAKDVYVRQGRLDQLQDDICAYVMCYGQWAEEELALKREIQHLLHVGALMPNGAFGYLSPHPTVYRSAREGTLQVPGRKFHFESGDDIVFMPWLARVSYPGLRGPARIGRLLNVTHFCLSCDAFPSASLLCERGLNVLRQTLRR